MTKRFLKAGHLPTLIAAFLYFDLSFMVWVLLGPLGVTIAGELHLNATQKGLMVAVPVLAGAGLRVVLGLLMDRFRARRVGIGAQIVVIAGLAGAWTLGMMLGLAGASFAVALPLASVWYPPEHQGMALGLAGTGNLGIALASLFAPGLALIFGWVNVVGLATIPLTLVLVLFVVLAKDSPTALTPKRTAGYLRLLRIGDAWRFMFFYSITSGGFVGLASSLPIYFHDQYGLPPSLTGNCTAMAVFAGSLARPLGGALADRMGGVRVLAWLYVVAACAFAAISSGLASIWLTMPMFILGMLALGMGNGAVFQFVPQRFSREIGVMTGLVGMAGGVGGGFYLAFSLGISKQLTGSYGPGFLLFALLALAALVATPGVRRRWRSTWAGPSGAARV